MSFDMLPIELKLKIYNINKYREKEELEIERNRVLYDDVITDLDGIFSIFHTISIGGELITPAPPEWLLYGVKQLNSNESDFDDYSSDDY